MKNSSDGYRFAAMLLMLSAALHLLGAAISGFVDEGKILLPVVVLYSVLAALLWQQRRAVAYVVFVFMLIGGLGSWIASGGVNAVPTFIYLAITCADFACAALLFVLLWRGPDALVTPEGR